MNKTNTGTWNSVMAKSTKPSKEPVARSRTRRKKKPKETGVPAPFENQVRSVEVLLKEPQTLDLSDPGTGKTRSHLEAWATRRRKGGKCLFILAPKSILQSAWGDDIDKFFPNEFTYSIAYAHNRVEAIYAEADIYITNIDAATWLLDQPGRKIRKFINRCDELIIDESESIKHRTSKRSKAIIALRKYFPYRRCLSATPNSRTITDLWNQVYFVDDGQRLGPSFFRFRQQVCEAKQVGPRANMIQWTDKEGVEEYVAGLIADITIRHKFEDCQSIPENHSYTVNFELNTKHRTQYEELRESFVLTLQKADVVALNAAVLTNKLLQLTSGAVYTEVDDYEEINHDRNELILELVQEREYSLVFFNWKHQKTQLAKLAKLKGIQYEIIDGSVPIKKREAIVRDYQAGFYQTLFLHPKSAAHGLTLTRGRTTIWASPVYEPNIMRQGLGRIYRAGQTEKTENIMICARDTLEEHVYQVMNKRAGKMNTLLDLVD